MDAFKEIMVMTRVINSGVIMSIEKNEKELKGLERELINRYKYAYCSLCNTFCAALHSALFAQGYRRNDVIKINKRFETAEITRFMRYLELRLEPVESLEDDLIATDILLLQAHGATSTPNASMAIIDFTQCGYGPAAAVLTNDREKFLLADRLKIFGHQDLQTMWEGASLESDAMPTIQFNYRLSPLVAALIRNNLLDQGAP